jgi:signal transduction histidine kinase/CheY-like chemotaxis protein
MAGDTLLKGQDALVDAVLAEHGFGCTIFDRNLRIATTAVAAGSTRRAVGTTTNELITQQVYRLGKRFEGITRTIGKDWVIVYEALRDEQGRIEGLLAAYRELDHFLDDFRKLDDATAGAFLLRPDGTVLDANRGAADMLGRTLDALGVPFDPAIVARAPRDEPEAMELVWTRSDGHAYPVAANLRTLPDGNVLALARDYTIEAAARAQVAGLNAKLQTLNDRLEVEVADRTRELRETLAQRAAMVDNLTDGLVAVDANGLVQVLNPALRAMLDRHDVPLTALHIRELHPDLATAVDQCASLGKPVHLELMLMGDRIGGALASPIFADDPTQAFGAVVLVRDITLAKEVDRMKTDFIATVSHELRTPLTSVMGFAKLARRKVAEKLAPALPADDKRIQRAIRQVTGNLDIIVEEGARLAGLINDVLDISKMEAGEVDWNHDAIDVAVLLDDAVRVTSGLFQDGDVRCKIAVEPGMAPIEGDRTRLLQVLINLLSNARKFTEDGHVLVEGRVMDTGGVELAVVDTGCGIGPDDLEAVFQKFKQAANTLTDKPQGTGLGLPICKHIVERHGGTISVESERGVGSTFRVRLPPAGETLSVAAPRASRTPLPVARSVRTAEILSVDDDPSLRERLGEKLRGAGHHTRTAVKGVAGLQAVREKRPDLVLLDVCMPDITGFDVAASLRNDPATADLPILVLSVMLDRHRGDAVGVNHAMTKPIDDQQLLDAIQSLLQPPVT